MDIRCPRCGEPWDNDELHYEAQAQGTTYQDLAAKFRRVGCEVFGVSHNELTEAHPFIGELYALLGEDMDGAAAMIEDFGL